MLMNKCDLIAWAELDNIVRAYSIPKHKGFATKEP